MRAKVLLSLAGAFVAAVALVSASGAATTKAQKVTKIDVSTRAAVVHYLRSIHVNPKGVVIQRGLRNYAGAHCPGKGWTCAGTRHTVVQIAKRGGLNRFACGTSKCAVVQFGVAARGLKAAGRASKPKPPPNTALCVKTTGITGSCVINQPNASGTNKAVVWMVTPKLTGLTQSAVYSASITQGPASATGSSNNNLACVTQGVSIDGSTTSPSGSITVTSDAHQSVSIQQNSLTGSNTVQGAAQTGTTYDCGTATSSLTQTETLTSTVTGKGSITQNQDTFVGSPNVPNVLLDVEQNQNVAGGFKSNALATAPNSASFVQTSHMTAIANTPKGSVTQTQSSPDDNPPYSGIVAAINQDTTGISTASATQIETQCEDAFNAAKDTTPLHCHQSDQDKPGFTVTQTQYGPEGIYHSTTAAAQGPVRYNHKTPGDSAQTGNPGNLANGWTITQSSTQDNDTSSGQKNTIAGGITSSGTGTVNQNTLIQGSGTTDVQDGTNTVNSTILCPNGKNSCTKTLSAPKITQQPDDPSLYGSGKSFMFRNADPTVTFLCSLDGAAYGSCSNVTNPTITSPPYPPTTGYETTSGLASGKHTFSVETQDLANPSANPPATATITWWITPPDPTITNSPPDPDFLSSSSTFRFTDQDNTVQYQCSIDSQPAASCSSGVTYSGLSAGSHTFTVTAYGANDSTFSHPDTIPATFIWTILPLEVSALGGDDESSAGWACQPGGPIALTVGSTPYDPETDIGTFAQVAITDAGGTSIDGLSEPTFTTDNYAAGSPRYVIDLSNGDSLWGYPPNAGLNGTDFAWAINNGNSYLPWSVVRSSESASGTTITDAVVIADGDQVAGTTDKIGNLQFNGTTFNSGTCS